MGRQALVIRPDGTYLAHSSSPWCCLSNNIANEGDIVCYGEGYICTKPRGCCSCMQRIPYVKQDDRHFSVQYQARHAAQVRIYEKVGTLLGSGLNAQLPASSVRSPSRQTRCTSAGRAQLSSSSRFCVLPPHHLLYYLMWRRPPAGLQPLWSPSSRFLVMLLYTREESNPCLVARLYIRASMCTSCTNVPLCRRGNR